MKTTTKQLAVLQVIARHVERNGRAPTIQEIMAALGFNSTNAVVDHLRTLERKGLITRERKIARSILITLDGSAALGLSASPYTLAEWDGTQEPDIARIRATIVALERHTRRKAVAA